MKVMAPYQNAVIDTQVEVVKVERALDEADVWVPDNTCETYGLEALF